MTDVLPNSIIPLTEIILATANNKVYESTDGIAWAVSTKFSGEVNTFISKLPIENDTKITYIKTKGEERYFYSMMESDFTETEIEKVDKRFPVDNISYTTFSKGKKHQNIIVGKHEPAIEIDINNKKVPVTVTWGYDGTTWAELGATTAIAYCPAFDNPNIIYYNDLFYIFGEKLESIYVSNNEGVAWKKANKKVAFLNHDWSESNITESTKEHPEFRGRKNYSVVQDKVEKFIYILFSREEGITFTEEVEKEEETRATEPKDRGPYSHNSEVWRGRLNQLWFDLDPQRAGQ